MDEILVERSDGIVTVTLNKPEKKNACTNEMWFELGRIFREIGANPDDRVVIVTGAGGDFCSGADLSGGVADRTGPQAEMDGLTRMRRIGDAALALHTLSKPTIAKVPGVAAGAGCNLAIGCDLVVAGRKARFAEIFAKRGLSLDFGGSWLLPRVVGMQKAKELALFADVIDSAEAERIGLVTRVVEDDELDVFVADWAARLAAGPPMALSMTKTMLNNAFAVSFSQAIEDEARSQNVNFGTEDMAEAMAAFVQKRPPKFTGR